jgi:hypothetical protein
MIAGLMLNEILHLTKVLFLIKILSEISDSGRAQKMSGFRFAAIAATLHMSEMIAGLMLNEFLHLAKVLFLIQFLS